MQIESIRFKNYKVLADTTLQLGPLTVLIGPNGSGKSTVVEFLRCLPSLATREWIWAHQSAGTAGTKSFPEIELEYRSSIGSIQKKIRLDLSRTFDDLMKDSSLAEIMNLARSEGFALYQLSPTALRAPVPIRSERAPVDRSGHGFSAFLDWMKDRHEEQFEALNREFCSFVPEYGRIILRAAAEGRKQFGLRLRSSRAELWPESLSDGTVLALALLALSYDPQPPALMAFEEPDNGLHPRLMVMVRDALMRLAYPPADAGRRPVQVIATTHSPTFVSLFRDYPENVVIASKQGEHAAFRRLVDVPQFEQILASSALGDAWYSGFLGGVPDELDVAAGAGAE